MKAPPCIVWFRQDLRLADNPALAAALKLGAPIVPVYIWSPDEEGDWPPGGASKWWLHQSLQALDASLRKLDSQLVLRAGPAQQTLRALIDEMGAQAVFWNRRYEPVIADRDKGIEEALPGLNLTVETFNAGLLHEPWTIQNRSGKPFQVFTPFWKHCLSLPDPPEPLKAPRKILGPAQWPRSIPLKELDLEPKNDWAGGLRETWQPGEAGAENRLKQFITHAVADYTEQRNFPSAPGTSRFSPHLHFGEVSPRQVWHRLKRRAEKHGLSSRQWRSSQFLMELGWREFAHHLLYHYPHTPVKPLRPEFEKFRWRKEPDWLRAWQTGRTGYPIVDAGMRELWATGWMHNRVRMIVASFLVKDLLISWQEGVRWFWDTLIDADLANNTLGWQWTAGCGADAAPFFRIFNPTTQGEKFDANGEYVRRWCPELAKLPAKWIHHPNEAPLEVLRAGGVELGRDYPEPIVSHIIAREVALEAFAAIKGTR